jgi:hypothetical protein
MRRAAADEWLDDAAARMDAKEVELAPRLLATAALLVASLADPLARPAQPDLRVELDRRTHFRIDLDNLKRLATAQVCCEPRVVLVRLERTDLSEETPAERFGIDRQRMGTGPGIDPVDPTSEVRSLTGQKGAL